MNTPSANGAVPPASRLIPVAAKVHDIRSDNYCKALHDALEPKLLWTPLPDHRRSNEVREHCVYIALGDIWFLNGGTARALEYV